MERLIKQNLYEHFRYAVPEGQKPLRVDKFLMNFLQYATRNKIQQAAKQGHIWVNDTVVKSNYKVKPNDLVKVLLGHPPHENLLVPENILLDIIYEDSELIVINKPQGMVVHPGHGNYSGTLVNGLLYHIKNLPKNNQERPGLVHRIDKNTSGLLVVAKTEKAMAHLSEQFFHKTTKRIYDALVWGDLKTEKGTIQGNIGRNLKNRLQMQVFPENDFGKPAITHYEVVERFGYVTMVSCRLETGRTHQIRAHFKHIGHTLFGDERYGGDAILKGTTYTKYKQFVANCFELLKGQALHAKTLGFIHPKTQKQMEFESELPENFKMLLEKWKNYAHHKK